VTLSVKAQLISNEKQTSFSEKKLLKIIKTPFSKNSVNKLFVISNPEEIHSLPIELSQHQLWLISLKTDRTIIPKEHDQKSTDVRELGIRVLF